jgi:SAM-dependent methyltransferase
MRRLVAVRRLEMLEKRLSHLAAVAYEGEGSVAAEPHDEAWGRSRARWRAAGPDSDLTWGKKPSGEPFILKAAEYGALGPDKRIVEVGPGYGRILQACIDRGDGFRSYLGVDLSHDNVDYLRQHFASESISFVEGDVETVDFGEGVDGVISSLTFKHLFPDFERALAGIARKLAPGGRVVFDLIEGERVFFEDDGVTYIHCYSREEVRTIVAKVGLELVALDEVYHLPQMKRLLVVAGKPHEQSEAPAAG